MRSRVQPFRFRADEVVDLGAVVVVGGQQGLGKLVQRVVSGLVGLLDHLAQRHVVKSSGKGGQEGVFARRASG